MSEWNPNHYGDENGLLQKLKGKLIFEVWTNEERNYLKFVTDAGSFQFYAYGDCCSKSWFESFQGSENLIGEVVLEAIVKPEGESIQIWATEEYKKRGWGPDELIRIYGFSLKTAKGYFDIEMRNSSNGFYGGMLVEPKDTLNWVDLEPDEYDICIGQA